MKLKAMWVVAAASLAFLLGPQLGVAFTF